MEWRRMKQGGAGAVIVSEGVAAGVLEREIIKRVFIS
jgi:hypothetical protein